MNITKPYQVITTEFVNKHNLDLHDLDLLVYGGHDNDRLISLGKEKLIIVRATMTELEFEAIKRGTSINGLQRFTDIDYLKEHIEKKGFTKEFFGDEQVINFYNEHIRNYSPEVAEKDLKERQDFKAELEVELKDYLKPNSWTQEQFDKPLGIHNISLSDIATIANNKYNLDELALSFLDYDNKDLLEMEAFKLLKVKSEITNVELEAVHLQSKLEYFAESSDLSYMSQALIEDGHDTVIIKNDDDLILTYNSLIKGMSYEESLFDRNKRSNNIIENENNLRKFGTLRILNEKDLSRVFPNANVNIDKDFKTIINNNPMNANTINETLDKIELLHKEVKYSSTFMTNLDSKNINSTTPDSFLHKYSSKLSLLETAIKADNNYAVNYLIEKGADTTSFSIVDINGKTRTHDPLGIALLHDNSGAAMQLLMNDPKLLRAEHIDIVNKKYVAAEVEVKVSKSLGNVIKSFAIENNLPMPIISGDLPKEFKVEQSRIEIFINKFTHSNLSEKIDNKQVEHIPNYRVQLKDENNKLVQFGDYKFGRSHGIHVSFNDLDNNRIMSVANFKNGFEKNVPNDIIFHKDVFNNNIKAMQDVITPKLANSETPSALMPDKNSMNYSVLETAVMKGNIQATQLLIDNGAKVNSYKLSSGRVHDPISLAIKTNNPEILTKLIKGNKQAVNSSHKQLSSALTEKYSLKTNILDKAIDTIKTNNPSLTL